MTNVVITNGGTHVDVAFNGTNGEANLECRRASTINTVSLLGFGTTKGTYVQVDFADGGHWTFDVEGGRGLTVDTVVGAIPASNADLVTKIAALIQA